MHTTKSACENLNYRRNQKYFRTLTPWHKTSEYGKPKLRPFRILVFAFSNQPKLYVFIFLPHVTPSSAAVFKLRFCGILLRSKTTKLQLKNCPVQRSGTVLQRLVRLFQLNNMVIHNCVIYVLVEILVW